MNDFTEDQLVQKTMADYLATQHGWRVVMAWNKEVFGAEGTLGVITAASLRLVQPPAGTGVALMVVPDPDAALRLLAQAQARFGEGVTAVVVASAEAGLTEAAVLGVLERRLAKFKLPKSIDYIGEMPRDPNGKLYKRKLRDPYWEGRGAKI